MLVDIIIIVVVFAIFMFITQSKGKQFVISSIFALSLSILITKYLLFEPTGFELVGNTLLISFAGILIVSFFAIKKYVENYRANGGQGYVGAAFLSLSATLLLMAAYFYFLPETYYSFNSEIRDIFFKKDYTLGIIFALPVVALLVSAKDD